MIVWFTCTCVGTEHIKRFIEMKFVNTGDWLPLPRRTSMTGILPITKGGIWIMLSLV